MTTDKSSFTHEDWENYARLAADLIDLPIPNSSMAGVVETLATTSKVAQPLMEMDLPEGTEMAPTFKS